MAKCTGQLSKIKKLAASAAGSSFLDEYCIIFDTEDENKLEYTKIHNDFKNLVEELIGHLLAELGVTQEQFMEAC